MYVLNVWIQFAILEQIWMSWTSSTSVNKCIIRGTRTFRTRYFRTKPRPSNIKYEAEVFNPGDLQEQRPSRSFTPRTVQAVRSQWKIHKRDFHQAREDFTLLGQSHSRNGQKVLLIDTYPLNKFKWFMQLSTLYSAEKPMLQPYVVFL